jgi:hypothetical protein
VKRAALNALIDLLAGVFFLGMLASGYILRFPLPPGSNADFVLWGLNRYQWGDVHYLVSLGLLATLLTHVALHWQWVVSVMGRRIWLTSSPGASRMRSTALVLITLVGAMSLFGWFAYVSVREVPDLANKSTLGLPGTQVHQNVISGKAELQIDFWKDVYPIFKNSCLSCHGPQRARGDFRADRREDFFGGGGREPLVLAGKSAESPILAIISGKRPNMPMAKSHKLPERDIAVLTVWIDAGAPWPEAREGK